jgi:polyphosphate kinase
MPSKNATSNERQVRQIVAKSKRNRRAKHSPLDDPELYINRELSLLAFQRRVLEEARDPRNPLLERVKFLSIVASNLDEFFMVRVATLIRQVETGVAETGADGMPPSEQLAAIREQVASLLENAYACFRSELLPALAENNIRILNYADLTGVQQAALDRYFRTSVFPTLTPLAFDPGRPFPLISNLSVNLAVSIRDPGGVEHFARVKIPGSLPQLVEVPSLTRSKNGTGGKTDEGHRSFVWLEQLVAANLDDLFPGMKVLEVHPFHVTRDAESAIQDVEADDLLEFVEEGVWQRRFADVVRLQVNAAMPPGILDILMTNLKVDEAAVYRLDGPVDLCRLKHLLSLECPQLKDPVYLPAIPAALQAEEEGEEDIFSAIRREDILLHHPYDSFQPVVNFLKQSARDPDVLAIKITLYRVGRKAPVVEALLEAIENGKQVAAVVELKARFDEESNIEWARALERQGVHVVYGLVGLKVHAKAALVVRREAGSIRRYVHLSTGNYNAITAQLYTDIGLFTSDEKIGADTTDLFNYLTGYSAKNNYRKLLVAPVNLRSRVARLIRREIDHQRAGRPAHLILKMNSLVDRQMIRLLYEASQAGVRIDLLVRGICCLRPGIPGVSDNIRVVSIVGRFLEHSRIYYFQNGGQDEIYLASADLMPRNLNRRVETLFPVQNRALVQQLRNVLEIYLSDNVKARVMRPDGSYIRPKRTGKEINSQQRLLEAPHTAPKRNDMQVRVRTHPGETRRASRPAAGH